MSITHRDSQKFLSTNTSQAREEYFSEKLARLELASARVDSAKEILVEREKHLRRLKVEAALTPKDYAPVWHLLLIGETLQGILSAPPSDTYPMSNIVTALEGVKCALVSVENQLMAELPIVKGSEIPKLLYEQSKAIDAVIEGLSDTKSTPQRKRQILTVLSPLTNVLDAVIKGVLKYES